jgi:hypothetical protein
MEKFEYSITIFINKMCDLKITNGAFPGGMPTSLSRDMIPRLFGEEKYSHHEYAVARKADGDRCYLGFLCIEGNFISFLVNRKFQVEILDFKIYDHAYEGTLFDVELVKCDNSYLLLIFDCISIHGNSVTEMYYPNRREIAKVFMDLTMKHNSTLEYVVNPAEEGEYPSNHSDHILTVGKYMEKDLRFKVKTIFYASYSGKVKPSLLYNDDGRVWTSASLPYAVFRTSPTALIKWKPLHLITIDVRLFNTTQISWTNTEDVPEEFIIRQGNWSMLTEFKDQVFLLSMLTSHDTSIINNGIYEVAWNDVDLSWHVIKRRRDKETPNHLVTIIQTMKNMIEKITVTELIH